jgi:hypothetical protein
LFEPITICWHVALRNREDRWPTPDLANLARGRWYELPDGHGLFRVGVMITPIPGPAEVITAGPLRAAGVTVTGVDINELDKTLTTGPWRGRAGDRADRVHYGRDC